MNLDPLYLWKFVDELTVIDAAILIAGGDPNELRRTPIWASNPVKSPPAPSIVDGGSMSSLGVNRSEMLAQYQAQEAAKTVEAKAHQDFLRQYHPIVEALKSAVLSGDLRGSIAVFIPAKERTALPGNIANREALEKLISAAGETIVHYNTSFPEALEIRGMPVEGGVDHRIQPCWQNTKIARKELSRWLSSRGLRPEHFFEDSQLFEYEDQANPRYSSELACAVAAWKAVQQAKPGKSVKQTLDEWIRSNAVVFGVDDGSGVPPDGAVERIASLVNWNKKGGAPKTPG